LKFSTTHFDDFVFSVFDLSALRPYPFFAREVFEMIIYRVRRHASQDPAQRTPPSSSKDGLTAFSGPPYR
jgi:hypothetical protein